METDLILKRIKKLEFASGFLATMAPIAGALLGFDKRMLVFFLSVALALLFNHTFIFCAKKFVK